MKPLNFGSYSSTEWKEFKRIHREMFWDELEERSIREATRFLQAEINAEFDMQIGALWYERTESRRDERNGNRVRSYEIKGGRVAELVIPRSRKLDIRFTVFDRWERVQPRVLTAMLKAYLLSRGSGCAQEIVEAFGQSEFSRSFLQRLVKRFENRLRLFHERRLKTWPYVFMDGMSVKVFDSQHVKEKVVIVALGMDDEHRSEILDWVVAESEDEVSVRGLLIDLKRRGLVSPRLFITDDSRGILTALRLEYPHTERQLCSFHKISNIQRHLKNISLRAEILREAGDIYELSTTRTEAVERMKEFSSRWRKKEPEAVRLFRHRFEDTLRYFDCPMHMWVSLRTNNPLEQLIGKLRDWTRRYTRFHGQMNLELALYTYVCHKTGELEPKSEQQEEVAVNQIPTLLVA
jgi:putative transposase